MAKKEESFEYPLYLSDERKAALQLMQRLRPNDLVIYDRGYMSERFLRQHVKNRVHGLFRIQKNSLLEFKDCRTGSKDRIVNIKRRDFEISIRVIRYQIAGRIYLQATTLTNKELYPRRQIIEMYHRRWQIEEGYKFLKRGLKLLDFKSRNSCGIKQEILISLIILFLARILEFTGRRNETLGRITKKIGRAHV